MLNFKKFTSEKLPEDERPKVDENISSQKIEEVQSVINKYAGMSESDLTAQIAKAIKEQKSSGNFDKAAAFSQIDSLAMVLTEEQRANMKKLLDEFS